jgi:polar amino acid transport system substrate-binding protein
MISRRRLTAGVLGGLGAVSQRGAVRAAGAEGVMARVQRTKTLRFGVVNGQPPYCYKDLATGEWRGFLVDITTDLARELGAGVQPVESTWGNAVLDVQANKVDLFFGLAPTPERAKIVDFTKPLYQNAFSLICRKGFEPKTWDDLDDPTVKIAIELGSVYDLNVGHYPAQEQQ